MATQFCIAHGTPTYDPTKLDREWVACGTCLRRYKRDAFADPVRPTTGPKSLAVRCHREKLPMRLRFQVRATISEQAFGEYGFRPTCINVDEALS